VIIGSKTDVNGQVIVTADSAGPAGNNYSIEVRVPTSGGALPLSAAFDSTGLHIIVSLAIDGSNNPVAAANTATLVAAAINALAGVGATANGTGATSLELPEPRVNLFFGGGMPVYPTPYITYGQTTVSTAVGTLVASGSPMGLGEHEDATLGAHFSHNIRIVNTGGANVIEYSFDGVNVHGVVAVSSEVILTYRYESGIALRGVTTYRVEAW
jgi:hypothetical protein